MIEIELNNVKKNYGLKNILDGVNFEVKTGKNFIKSSLHRGEKGVI